MTAPRPQRINTIVWLLFVQSIVIILGSINRLSSLTTGYAAENEYLRWVDVINMLPLPILSLIAFYLLKKHLERSGAVDGARYRWLLALGAVFVIGVYVLGASYGDHEVTNYLHTRFCLAENGETVESDLCRIIIYNDDEFSHYLFFIGFVMINGAILFYQVLFPYGDKLTPWGRAAVLINALFIAAGIVANLAFEDIGLDMVVIVILAALSLFLLWRRGIDQPLILYYSAAYTIGLIAAVVVRLVRG